MAVARGRREEARRSRIGGDESASIEFGADLVVRLADHRADRRDDARAGGAELLHRGDRSLR